ncbi:DoxX family membrane protein [Halomicroarcula limicola]|uniref:DoxX family membrane protein n=1 Tax=Haloarcula limicola TaxID=1429915 RepID=A0A8J7Y7Y5_9EURY|nr:DoxX family membrane protein [Halomicroarcula limicola]MBV0923349.1 DoxX family membrane protein [Halomicroarcula limicola]
MSTRQTLRSEVLGRPVSFDYSETWVGYSLFFLRVVMGWTLFQGGVTKLVTYLDGDPANDWTAAGFLTNGIPEGNPLTGTFAAMAGNPAIDWLNMLGLTLAGLALLAGALVRFAAFWGAVMMLFYWLAALEGGLLAGLPVAHGWVVDDHIVYAVLLFGLGAFGAGRILGLDSYIEDTDLVENNPWLRALLG